MKKTILTLFIFTVLISACKKDEKEEESKPLTKEELLCQTWDIKTYTLNDFGYAWLPRLYHWKFKTDGSIEWYEIETGNLYKTTHWTWAEDQTALDIDTPEWEGQVARTKIVKLTETELILEPGDSDHQLEMTFSR
jgi:hypothetical protein